MTKVYKRYINYTMIRFEFDSNKSILNRKKHGLDFLEAQDLWNDSNLIEIPAKTLDEPRYLMIGKIKDKFWSCVITYRNENIRIISVRRARKEEIQIYESC
ncbi:MAG: hypothetical protein ACD_79C00449G0002 [uncultured bacterium]|nr:MAG: hypothetical protein ACD_79C00449G0002 [uncultured bacterium]